MSAAPPVRESVVFHDLPTSEPVTMMTLSEDGRLLMMSHQGAGRVSIWDVEKQRLAAVLESPAPRSLLSRGRRLYVAGYGEGIVNVFELGEDGWRFAEQLEVDKPHIVHMAAARGERFSGRILVTCHEGGRAASYQNSHVILLHPRAPRQQPISGASLAEVSYDGRLVMTQGSFNLSPSGGLTAYAYDEFLGGDAERVFAGGVQQTPYVYQAHPGSYWLGDNMVFGGVPIRAINEHLGDLIVPDHSNETQPVCYALTKARLTAHRLSASLPVIGDRKIEWPQQVDFTQIHHRLYRRRDYLLDHPVAYTHGENLYLFVLDMGRNVVLHAKTPAFDVGGAAAEIPVVSAAAVPRPPQLPPDEPVIDSKPAPNQPAERGSAAPAADDGTALRLDPDHFDIAHDEDEQKLLLLQGDRLRILGGDGITVVADKTLPKRYRRIAARERHFIALATQPPALDLIDKTSLKVTRSIPIKHGNVRVLEVRDFALHPSEPTVYLTIKHDIRPPRDRILIINERTGDITALDGLVGTWVAVDPRGRLLYAGYRDIYEKGSTLHLNPDWRLIEIPQYGNIDMLITYRLRGKRPELRQVIPEAGGNGYGIRLSPDGRRIVYLSHVGYPTHSQNLAGFNPLDLDQEPVTYETKGIGATTELAFHPTLKLVAVPAKSGSGSAVLFEQDTGKRLRGPLVGDDDAIRAASVERMVFSPDGSSLIFVCGGPQGRFLKAVPLSIPAADEARLRRDEAVALASERPEQIATPIDADDLDALRAGEAEPMSAKEIGEAYMRSVVVLSSDEAQGTGFVIGRKGYILTNSHTLPLTGAVRVTYSTGKGGSAEPVTTKAKVLLVDEARDLALLKIEAQTPLPPVVLAGERPVKAGEQVTVIGNPGVGEVLLSHTMTTGIVSNAARTINDLSYIQTSAPVNPGNSGGPVFDSNGRVIGVVTLKARIEATAFAIPANELRQFLKRAIR